jgi:hypothetical protein
LESAGAVAGSTRFCSKIVDLDHEAGDLRRAGLGQLGGALGSGLGSRQVDLGSGSHVVDLGGVGGAKALGDLPAGGLEGGDVFGTKALQFLGLGSPGGPQLTSQLAGDSLGSGLVRVGGGDSCLGSYPGLLEGLGQLGAKGFYLRAVLGS